jgi:tetratricopeptide (TPR) repeat protein
MTIRIIRSALLIFALGTSLICSCKVSKTITSNAVTAAADTVESRKNSDNHNEFEYLFIEGIKQRTIGNPDEAVKIFSRCLALDPNSSAALYEMANIHVSKGDFQSSMMMCEKAVSLNPDNKYYHLLLIKIYLQNKLYEKASKEYESLVNLFPDNQDYKFQLAATMAMAGKTTEALAKYNELEAKMGLTEPIAIGKQQIYLQQGNRQSAYSEIEKLIKLYPEEPKYYGLIADMYLADKNRDKALEYYNRIIQIDPEDGFVHLSIANFYLESKEYQKAYDHIKLAFKNPGLDLETKAQMFLLLSQPGEGKISDNQQSELLNILINIHLDDERPRSLLVDYLLSKKQPQEARKQMRLVLDMKKDNYLYWERLLLIDNDLLDWKTLCEDSHTALGYFPEQPLVYILNAVGLLQLKKYDELLLLLDKGEVYAKSDPKTLSQLYTYRAEAYYNLKRFQEAFDVFDKVVVLDPQNYMAMNNYAYYLSLKGERLDVAEKLSGKVVQANPDNSTYLDTYAWVLFKKKDFKLAKFYMESALAKNTEQNAILVEHYGDILFFLDDKQSAMVQWKKSFEMGNDSKDLKQKIAKGIYIESEEF